MACVSCHKTRAAIFSALYLIDGDRKTVVMGADYTYSVAHNININYISGETYRKVPNVVAQAIVAAGAGSLLEDD